MKHTFLLIAFLLAAAMATTSCTTRMKYKYKLRRELASGERHDSLFLGLSLGMTQREFYLHCWRLNQKGLLRQGTGNSTAEYNVEKELKYPATMNFYPAFENNRIIEMPVTFKYNGWAPWNKALSADSLQQDVLNWYKKTYGDDFLKVAHPSRGHAWVRIDGNRRITIYKKDDMTVWTIFTDMLKNTYPADSTAAASDRKGGGQ